MTKDALDVLELAGALFVTMLLSVHMFAWLCERGLRRRVDYDEAFQRADEKAYIAEQMAEQMAEQRALLNKPPDTRALDVEF